MPSLVKNQFPVTLIKYSETTKIPKNLKIGVSLHRKALELSSIGVNLGSITLTILVKIKGKMSKSLNKFEASPRLAALGNLTAQVLT